jgi:hypothetical protein
MGDSESPEAGGAPDATKPGVAWALSARPYEGSNPKQGTTQAKEASSYLYFRSMFLLRLMPMLLHDWFLTEKSPALDKRDPKQNKSLIFLSTVLSQ